MAPCSPLCRGVLPSAGCLPRGIGCLPLYLSLGLPDLLGCLPLCEEPWWGCRPRDREADRWRDLERGWEDRQERERDLVGRWPSSSWPRRGGDVDGIPRGGEMDGTRANSDAAAIPSSAAEG